MTDVLVAGPLASEALGRIGATGARVEVYADGVGGELSPEAAAARALVPLLTTRVDRGLLARLPRLELVANVSAGVDHVDLDACRARGVAVTNTPDVLTDATADLAFALLLAAARRVGEAERVLRSGGFPPWNPAFMLGKRVAGATLGVVGFGRIGRAVARRAEGFGMRVLYTSRADPPPGAPAAERVPLAELLARADFVSLHVPLSAATRHLIGRAELARMKPGSVLVNTSRGAVVDEEALAEALAHGPLFAAGLDVYEHEPKVHPALLLRENAVLVPHIGSAEAETRRAMAMLAADNVVALLEGRPLLTPV
ncbi:MAG: D-glycerate dehydrogenase [Myxococcales bacterium]|nr:D-glycerate dehydrogenase [Myxococcales bacterium]HQY63710.1 D-glycerate dehydrogenase [Polyangiaceae bacterium]